MTGAALCLLGVVVCAGPALAGQSVSAHRPRIDAAIGITSMTLRKLPADSSVGGQPIGIFARVGYFWTSYLATEFDIASQAESWNPDYALQYVARPVAGRGFELRTISLKHNYAAQRWTVTQVFRVRRLRFVKPYFGAGAGVESQTVTHSRHEGTPYLTETVPPTATTAEELPSDLPGPSTTRYTIGFAQAGLKLFITRRAYFVMDWTLAPGERVRPSGGFGIELF